MKKLKPILKFTIIIFLLIIYIYTVYIQSIPDNMIVFEGESINLKTILGLTADFNSNEETVETVSNNQSTSINTIGRQTAKISLFDNIFLKNVNIDVLPRTKVIPVGNIAGVKLYTNGVLVVGMSEIEGEDNKKYRPYENSGIEEGDTIIKVNDVPINSTDDLIETVNNSKGNKVRLEYVHDLETKECSIVPVKQSNSQYKLGLWVRDSAAGVGTVTFYEPSTKVFGALGHGISDIDTG